jgi:nucleotidyltransferase/DNA polymerase involved in DNA repair
MSTPQGPGRLKLKRLRKLNIFRLADVWSHLLAFCHKKQGATLQIVFIFGTAKNNCMQQSL